MFQIRFPTYPFLLYLHEAARRAKIAGRLWHVDAGAASSCRSRGDCGLWPRDSGQLCMRAGARRRRAMTEDRARVGNRGLILRWWPDGWARAPATIATMRYAATSWPLFSLRMAAWVSQRISHPSRQTNLTTPPGQVIPCEFLVHARDFSGVCAEAKWTKLDKKANTVPAGKVWPDYSTV